MTLATPGAAIAEPAVIRTLYISLADHYDGMVAYEKYRTTQGSNP